MDKKHSGIGIASFITSILVGALMFLMFVVAGVMAATTPGGINPKSAATIVLGLSIIALLLADFVALGLGIGDLCQRDRNKLFAVLGTVFSAGTMAGTVFLIIIGNLKR